MIAVADTKPRVLLIIPCFNEAGSIESLLKEITSCNKNYDTVVIDDGSRDDTYLIASRLSPTVRLLRNLGIGGAVQTGIKYALQNNFDFCVQIDGDGQHPPEEVEKLLAAYRNHPRNIITGSRYIEHDTFRSTWTRRLGSQVLAQSLNRLFKNCNISDPTSGMRLMDKKAIAFYAKNYPHDFPEPISLAWGLQEGLSVGEVPVKMRAREHGQSSIMGWKPLIYMFRVLGYIVLARFVYSSNR